MAFSLGSGSRETLTYVLKNSLTLKNDQFSHLVFLESSLKSAPDKKASSNLYRLHFLQVWPSLNIANSNRRLYRDDL